MRDGWRLAGLAVLATALILLGCSGNDLGPVSPVADGGDTSAPADAGADSGATPDHGGGDTAAPPDAHPDTPSGDSAATDTPAPNDTPPEPDDGQAAGDDGTSPADVPCVSECVTPGATRCYPDAPRIVERCAAAADGCLYWTLSENCPVGASCADGACVAGCQSDPGCAGPTDERCASAAAYQVCAEAGPDCWQFGEARPCPDFTVCVAGTGCVCQDDCTTEGRALCFDATRRRVCERTPAGCLVWSAPVACPNQGVCEGDGQCVSACEPDPRCTAVGQRVCYGADSFAVCTEVEPGCLRLGTVQPCGGTLTCEPADGSCGVECTSDCPQAAATRCFDATTEQVCAEREPGCLKWQAPVACDVHEACVAVAGACACSAPCTLGEQRCDPDDPAGRLLAVCVADAAGCTFWDYTFCGTTETCRDDTCASTCVSDPGCTAAGVAQCVSARTFARCEQVEPGCLQWAAEQSCPARQACSAGVCACVHEPGCTAAGLRDCQDATHARLCEADAAGCRAFAVETCPAGQTCAAGTCSTVCTSDAGCTAVGLVRCNAAGAAQTCTEVQPGCLKWGTAEPCGEHQACAAGTGCVCADACPSAGATGCAGPDFSETCQADPDGCLYWAPSGCPEGQFCLGTGCEPVRSPVVSCSDLSFTVVDRGFAAVLVAGDFNAWDPNAGVLTLADGLWTLTVPLQTAGDLQYKFVIDGQWTLDPLNPETVWDGLYLNNVVHVPAIDECESLGGTTCAPDGTVVACELVAGCYAYVLADACDGPAEHCAAGECLPIVSPVVDAGTVTFVVRDRGYTGLDVSGTFVAPEWGVFVPLSLVDGLWVAELQRSDYPLLGPAGQHRYKFRTAANDWFFDPANPEREPDPYGGFNSLLTLPPSCASTCSPVGGSECVSWNLARVCTTGSDGCADWLDAPCANAPPAYCLRTACEVFPVVDAALHTATFVVPQNPPAFTTVHVAGDFTTPPWSDGALALTQAEGGWWAGTSSALAAGTYRYKFVFDRGTATERWEPDNHNPNQEPDPYGGFNSLFTMP